MASRPPADAAREPSTRELILPLLVYKAGLIALVLLSPLLLPPSFDFAAYYGNFHWPLSETFSHAFLFKTWDAQHYLFLSQAGYAPGAESNRFFPLWPWAIRCAAPLFAGNRLVSALVLSNAFSFAGLLIFHRAAARQYGRDAADTSTLLLLACPGALFFAFPYSESLFFLLGVVFLVALSRQRPLVAALPAFLLPLARPVGIMVAVPLLYRTILAWRKGGRLLREHLLALAAPALSAVIYLAFMRHATGDAFEFLRGFGDQGLIGTATMGKMYDIGGFLTAFAKAGSLHAPLDSVVDRLFFVGFLLACWRLRRLDKTALAFALPMGVVPAMSLSFWGFTRYAVGAFPVFLPAGAFLAGEKRKAWRWVVLAALFALQVVFLFRHVNNRWAG